MSGASIGTVLDQAVHDAPNSGPTGAFPYAAGLRYGVDLEGAEGAALLNVEVQERGASKGPKRPSARR